MKCVLPPVNKAIKLTLVWETSESVTYGCIFLFNKENMCKNISFLDILITRLKT